MIRIGCAGWSIAARQADLFGAGESALARYATLFPVVEVNSSFHRSHRRDTWERWAAAVPRGFRFSVKLPKTITHEMRLVRSGPLLRAFAEEVSGLGSKLGGVLVQLPPSLAFDARQAGLFFKAMRTTFDVPIACEPRHASWFTPRSEGLWERYEVARVAADPPVIGSPDTPGGAGRWTYFRLHGAPRLYYSRYGTQRLRDLAAALRSSDRARRSAWCIFDNTAHAHAVDNAACLQGLLGGSSPTDLSACRDDAS